MGSLFLRDRCQLSTLIPRCQIARLHGQLAPILLIIDASVRSILKPTIIISLHPLHSSHSFHSVTNILNPLQSPMKLMYMSKIPQHGNELIKDEQIKEGYFD